MKEISLARFNEARRSWVEAGKYRLQIQRPTMLDILKAGRQAELTIEFAARFVMGWDNVTELDLFPGGDPEPAAFGREIFSAWVAGRPDLGGANSAGIAEAYKQHEERTAERGNA